MPVPSSAEKKSLERRSAAYHEQLFSPEGTDLLDYLIDARGLDPETISQFQLGAVVHHDALDAQASGKISIPYLTRNGVVALRFRRGPEGDGPKYWQPTGSNITIYNVNELVKHQRWIVVCEGEIDCITAVQAGLPAVGIPGASAWKDHYSTLFEGYERVVILADNDDKGAGAEFAKKVAGEVPDPAIITMPEGHDVNSLVMEHGPGALRELLKLDRKMEPAARL
jgi:DNA primase